MAREYLKGTHGYELKPVKYRLGFKLGECQELLYFTEVFTKRHISIDKNSIKPMSKHNRVKQLSHLEYQDRDFRDYLSLVHGKVDHILDDE
ncbi:MAG TPA: hypothetical protein VH796_00060 [Nitrososphaeraceae archaeon]